MSIFSAISDPKQPSPMYMGYHQALYEIEEEMEVGAYREFNKCDSTIEGLEYVFVLAGVMVISTIARAILGSFGRALMATIQTGGNLLVVIPSLIFSCCLDSEDDLHTAIPAGHFSRVSKIFLS
jgi:hypothetical protein